MIRQSEMSPAMVAIIAPGAPSASPTFMNVTLVGLYPSEGVIQFIDSDGYTVTCSGVPFVVKQRLEGE